MCPGRCWRSRRRFGVVAAMLAVELVDELVDGTKGAALPLSATTSG